MQRGTKLKTRNDISLIVKGKFPSGQLGLQEDHFEIVSPIGSFRLSKSLINYLFEDVTAKELEEEKKKLAEYKKKEAERLEKEVREKQEIAKLEEKAKKETKEAEEAKKKLEKAKKNKK